MAPVKIDISFCQNRGYLKGFQIIPSSQSTSIIVPLLAFRETSIRRDPIFIFGAANSSVKNQMMERLRLIGYLSPPACTGKERPHSNFILLSLIEDKTIYRAKTG